MESLRELSVVCGQPEGSLSINHLPQGFQSECFQRRHSDLPREEHSKISHRFNGGNVISTS